MEAFNGGNSLGFIPDAALVGKRLCVKENGTYSLVFDPAKTTWSRLGKIPSFHVAVTAVACTESEIAAYGDTVYKIVDLHSGYVEDVSRGDLLGGAYGTVETNLTWLSCVTELAGAPIVWTGVTNDTRYMTDKLVLRKIPAQTFTQLSPTRKVTFTNDYYIGVFEITKAQGELIGSGSTAHFAAGPFTVEGETRPFAEASYLAIRESPNENTNPACSWPSSHEVYADSFMGRLNARCPSLSFDLPTMAEFDCAGQADVPIINARYNGITWGNGYTTLFCETNLMLLARFPLNGGFLIDGAVTNTLPVACGPSNGTARVGSYLPNAYGLYDTMGNVYEWGLDYYTTSNLTTAVTNPEGPETGTLRVPIGGSFNLTSYARFSFLRWSPEGLAPDKYRQYGSNYVGFRVKAYVK